MSAVCAKMLGMGVPSGKFMRMVDRLAEVERAEARDYTSFSVRGKRFGYYWPRTETVGLKQTLSEQIALVAERPDVFEVQFTAGGFGWVVVHLRGIDADELKELVYEAWRLSAPEPLVEEHPTP
ncbi:YjbR protein [Saccharopolyspora spinosa]|uniref:YjbR protein n=2 Tax=Pseudonocardiaceae TaxID=2070 RepID=A0A2N3Y231_SACSN|nr:YjbR protein [Saccharopolyspora spinosa]